MSYLIIDNDNIEIIKKNYIIGIPQQGINQCPDGLLHVIKQQGEWYFVQMYNKHKEPSRIYGIFKAQHKKIVEPWLKSHINYSEYVLKLAIKLFEHNSERSDFTGLIAQPLGKITEILAEKFLANFTYDGESHMLNIEFKTKSQSIIKEDHINEISDFKKSIYQYFKAFSVITNIGFILESEILIDPEYMGHSGPWQLIYDNEPEGINELLNQCEVNDKTKELVDVLSTLNSQVSNRSKIIVGYAFVEKCIKEISTTKFFDLKKTDVEKLSKDILEYSQCLLSQYTDKTLDVRFQDTIKKCLNAEEVSQNKKVKSFVMEKLNLEMTPDNEKLISRYMIIRNKMAHRHENTALKDDSYGLYIEMTRNIIKKLLIEQRANPN